MSTTLVGIQMQESQWQPRCSRLSVGKDILELLSTSMYVDPMTLYREYVQNAADSIDEARVLGILDPNSPGRIQISLDLSKRIVLIRDNGLGIPKGEFEQRLSAFGASRKRGTSARGFRGVGRLAAIGSCQELIFRSRFAGEAGASEMKWDCRQVRSALRSEEHLGLQEVVDSCVKVRPIGLANLGDHGFEVELRGVVRHRNDDLLNPEAIYAYLSQVAPVPFSPSFTFSDIIGDTLGHTLRSRGLQIDIQGCPDVVYRPHRDELVFPSGEKLKFHEIEPVRVATNEGTAAALGWVLHHDYKGAIPIAAVRGLRLRCGNIQVGGSDLLQDYFQEPRFNSWTVGEIHTIDRRIIPNGRRDHYEQNAHFDNLVNHLSVLTRSIGTRCRASSVRRNWVRRFDQHRRTIQVKLGILDQGAVGGSGAHLLSAELAFELEQMRKIAAKECLGPELRSEMSCDIEELAAVVCRYARSPRIHRKLRKLSAVKRHVYEHAFSLIYKHVNETVAAQKLVEAMLVDL